LDISSDSVLGAVLSGSDNNRHAADDAPNAAREHNHREHKHHDVSLGMKLTTLGAIVVPFLALIAGIVMLWGWGFSWIHLTILVTMYVATGLGITIGFHRLFTHKSFETTRPIQAFFAVLGSMAVEGPLFTWVATHRRHHQHSDDEEDPHSPHLHGHGYKGLLKGIWHSHCGWLFAAPPPKLSAYIPDLMKSRMLTFISNAFPLWVIIGLLLPTIAGGLLTMSWTGALFGFVWGGLARVFLVHHLTWSINSVCHLWGAQPYRSHDESRNNVVMGVMAMGEGWHNNHHAFPTSARHGLAWWQFDLSYIIIRSLQAVGLAWQVRIPSPETLAAKRIDRAAPATADAATAAPQPPPSPQAPPATLS
jgi:stearoyl-CoA desaturase (delta-9 desaturase)